MYGNASTQIKRDSHGAVRDRASADFATRLKRRGADAIGGQSTARGVPARRRHRRAGQLHTQRLNPAGSVLRDGDRLRKIALQQWQQRDRRSLLDLLTADSGQFSLRMQTANALYSGQQVNAQLLSMGRGGSEWLR